MHGSIPAFLDMRVADGVHIKQARLAACKSLEEKNEDEESR